MTPLQSAIGFGNRLRPTRIAVCLACGGLLALGTRAAVPERPPPESPGRFEYARFKLGTRFRLVLYAESRPQANQVADLAFRRVDELDRLLSDYRDDSELARVNRHAQQPLRVSRELFEVLEAGRQFSERTAGAFDVTVGPVVQLWRQSLRTGKLPPAQELAEARSRVGFRKLELRAASRTVRLAQSGMKLDLGGIGKGFIADEVAVRLRRHGITRYLIDAGGDLTCGDPPPGRSGWTVFLEACGSGFELELANRSLASSGDLYRVVEIEQVRYSHIVDPLSGRSVQGPVASAALARTGLLADAAATAAAVLDADRILEFFPDGDDVAVCVSRGSGPERRVFLSPGLIRLKVDPAVVEAPGS